MANGQAVATAPPTDGGLQWTPNPQLQNQTVPAPTDGGLQWTPNPALQSPASQPGAYQTRKGGPIRNINPPADTSKWPHVKLPSGEVHQIHPEDVDEALARNPGASVTEDTGVLAGLKRIPQAITGVYHAFTNPASDQEKADLLAKVREQNAKGDNIPEDLATNPSRATLAYHRLIDAPADELELKGHNERAAAKDLLSRGETVEGVSRYLSGLTDAGLSSVPLAGPMVESIANRAEKGDVSGAATDIAAAIALENAPAIVRGGGKVAGRVGEAASDAVDLTKQKLADAHALYKRTFIKPDEPVPSAPTPKPITPHVDADTPLDNAALANFDKSLSKEARNTIRGHVGDTVPAGSSVKNQMTKVVAPVNRVIEEQGLALNKVLQDAPHFDTTAASDVQTAINKLKQDLPGGTEEQFGKAIDKELARARDIMQSSDPVEINNFIRDLDKRISSYTAPEEPLNTPSDAADAARVTIRRALRDKLNSEIPATKPINDVLGRNLEVRNVLRKKLGDVAYDSVAADAQHASEFSKGQTIIKNAAKDAAAKADYEAQVARVQKNLKRLRYGTTAAALAVFHDNIAKLLELL